MLNRIFYLGGTLDLRVQVMSKAPEVCESSAASLGTPTPRCFNFYHRNRLTTYRLQNYGPTPQFPSRDGDRHQSITPHITREGITAWVISLEAPRTSRLRTNHTPHLQNGGGWIVKTLRSRDLLVYLHRQSIFQKTRRHENGFQVSFGNRKSTSKTILPHTFDMLEITRYCFSVLWDQT